jgi:hypothetical protein
MRKIAFIGLATGALALATLPARADDQTISRVTGQVGGPAWPARTQDQQARAASGQHRAGQRAAPRVSSDAYAGFAQGGAFVQTCSHVGGPKGGSWTCR